MEGALEGSLAVWWLCLANDLADSERTGVAILSNYGPEVNSSNVVAVVGFAGMS